VESNCLNKFSSKQKRPQALKIVFLQTNQRAEAMKERIIAIYCLCDDFIQNQNFFDWHNVKISTSEMMSFVVAMRFFYGNLDLARRFLYEHEYIRKYIMLSCLNKHVHKI
jgi:hypothetical protein